MINVRIYNREHKQIDSIQFMSLYINNKYSVITALNKAFEYTNAKYGNGRLYEFALLSYADNTDYKVKND